MTAFSSSIGGLEITELIDQNLCIFILSANTIYFNAGFIGKNMQKAEQILSEMEAILDELVLNAEQLCEVSQKVIAEEELSSLQVRQEQLVASLIKLDHDFQHAAVHTSNDRSQPLQNRIQKKLVVFENLNSSFINNILSSHGLIQFETGELKKLKRQFRKKSSPSKSRPDDVKEPS